MVAAVGRKWLNRLRVVNLMVLLCAVFAAVVIDGNGSADGRVALGSRATISADGSGEQTYTLVGAAEANPREGRISNESPLGKALLGSQVGDEVRVAAPEGDIVYQVLAVE